MASAFHKVFVYGTLKKGFPNHSLLANSENGLAKFLFVGKTIEKYPLVVASSAMVPFLLDSPGKGNRITGEVYEVDDTMMAKLDKLEDIGRLYNRCGIDVERQECRDGEDSQGITTCGAYLLPSFKETLLELPLLECYAQQFAKDYIPGNDRSNTDIIREVRTGN